MCAFTETDGGKVWKQRVEGNPMSFEEVYVMNNSVDVSAAQVHAKALAKELAAKI